MTRVAINQHIKFDTPIGEVAIKLNSHCILSVTLCGKHKVKASSQSCLPLTQLARQAEHTINAYFDNPATQFNLPLDYSKGTTFQQRVWHALNHIPCGSTLTYGQLATKLNSSAQAIGNACRSNPFPIVIPCHRIVSKTSLGGYAGKTQGHMLEIKQFLLNHEARINRSISTPLHLAEN